MFLVFFPEFRSTFATQFSKSSLTASLKDMHLHDCVPGTFYPKVGDTDDSYSTSTVVVVLMVMLTS